MNHPDHIAAGEVALRTINPDASTRQMFPELWRDEKLEPHKPKALFLETFGDGGTVIDISDTMETKIKALLLHRSQLGPEAEGFVRDWNKRTGKVRGLQVRRVLQGHPARPAARRRDEAAPPRSLGSRGIQRWRRSATFRPANVTPSRWRRARCETKWGASPPLALTTR